MRNLLRECMLVLIAAAIVWAVCSCFPSCQPVPHSTPPETTLSPKDSLILAVLSADTNYSDWAYNIGQASPEQYREALTYKIQAIYGLSDSAKIGVIVRFVKDSL